MENMCAQSWNTAQNSNSPPETVRKFPPPPHPTDFGLMRVFHEYLSLSRRDLSHYHVSQKLILGYF